MSAAMIIEYQISRYIKKTATLLLFLEGQVHVFPSVYFHFHTTALFQQYLKWN